MRLRTDDFARRYEHCQRTEQSINWKESTMSSNNPPLCRFFALNGNCRNGSNCRFSHELPENQSLQEARKSIPCTFFLRGNCRYGDSCCFSHEATNNTDPPSLTCGICLEDVIRSNHKFGLLSNCNHVFCFECLMNWRKSGSTDATDRRVCPQCRKHSEYVVPSSTYATGTEKAQIIEAIKARRATIPCQKFNGTLGSCPFGRDCFYAHFDEFGSDIKSLDDSMQELYSKRNRKRRARTSDVEDLLALLFIRDMMANMQGDGEISMEVYNDLLQLFGW